MIKGSEVSRSEWGGVYKGFGLPLAEMDEINPFSKEAKAMVLVHIGGRIAKQRLKFEDVLKELVKERLVIDVLRDDRTRGYFHIPSYEKVLEFVSGVRVKRRIVPFEKLKKLDANRAMVFCVGFDGNICKHGAFLGLTLFHFPPNEEDYPNMSFTNAFVFSPDEDWKPVMHHEEG